jgi:hypothetical protein
MSGQKKPSSRAEITERIRAAGKRARAEAEARRSTSITPCVPAEVGGRDGPEPTRFGDWERNGIISDF